MIKNIEKEIIDFKDFPKEGIIFKDIMPVLENPETRKELLNNILKEISVFKPEAIVGIESRGFFMGMLIAHELNLPFIPIRKKGKLPGKLLQASYQLEYGEDKIEIQEDRIKNYNRILIHDDVLATGGTCEAALKMLEGKNLAVSFIMEIEFLKGREKIKNYTNNIFNVLTY